MILFLNKINEYWEEKIEKIRKDFPDENFIVPANKQEESEYLRKTETAVVSRLAEDDLKKVKNLKVLFIPYTGVNFFPLKKIKEKGIKMANVHGNSQFVAERALALALSLMGRIVEYDRDLREGYWHRGEGKLGRWRSLYNKKCGILGTGHIGKKLAKLLKPFNCKIIGYRRHIDRDRPAGFNEIYPELQEVIKMSDIVFITLPLTHETREIINGNILENMKGKFLINVGRGKIVEQEALYRCLKQNILGGAGLDVWYNYPGDKNRPLFPSDYPIFKMDNVVITPHNAGNTDRARRKNIDETFENIRRYLEFGEPEYLVNLDLYY